MNSFKEPQISNTVWSFATLEIKDEKIFEFISKHIATMDLNHFNEQGISTIVWSYASLKIKDKNLFELLAKHIILRRDLKKIKTSWVTDFLNTYPALPNVEENSTKGLVEDVSKLTLTKNFKDFNPKHISKSLYQYALSNPDKITDKDLLKNVSKQLLKDGALERFCLFLRTYNIFNFFFPVDLIPKLYVKSCGLLLF